MPGDSTILSVLNLSLNTLKNIDTDNEDICNRILEQLRIIINSCQKLSTPNALLPPCLTELAEVLLKILGKNFCLTLDTITLCGVAFALVLSLVVDAGAVCMMYSKTFLYPREDNLELNVKFSKASETVQVKIEGSEDAFRLSLSHGLLQVPDAFWNLQVNWAPVLQNRMFPILEKHCLGYSCLSLLSFKTLVLWCMRSRTIVDSQITSSMAVRMINIIASNWESPMNGVREQNFILLEQLLLFTEIPVDPSNAESSKMSSPLQPQAILDLVITEMSWMSKSKYFFLAAVIPKAGLTKSLQMYSEDIVYGLLNSLSYPHLAPAGSDLYKVCIDTISSDQWEQIFLQPIITVLTISEYMLQKQNFFKYWLNPTMRKYKISLQIIYDSLLESRGDIMFPIVCCMKAGRKDGYESMRWPMISTSSYLTKGLRHYDEMTRAHAFATVCNSPKISIFPCDEEFQTVETFLTENINTDSTPLRHSLVISFTVFLCRTRDACLQVMRSKFNQSVDANNIESRTLSRAMSFLEWLYSFLRSNLEICTNYQRKITTLELYKTVLSHLSNESGFKKNSTKSDGQRVMKYAIAVGRWGFTSEISRESLLYTLTDENEDVRESAGFLLMSHFKMNENEGVRFKELFKSGLILCCNPMFYTADAGALLLYVVTCLTYKNPTGDCKCFEIKEDRVISHLLNLAEKHVVELRKDILKAATNGYPLYGILRVLDRLANDKQSPEYNKFNPPETQRLITLIETISQYLLQVLASKSSSITEYAPSFFEMGEAIESVVEESEVNIEESDKLQLSPAHQLVLNTIWLNLKACCTLASRIYTQPGYDNVRCLSAITSVLRQTRHKGALESAGSALAQLTKALTEDRRVEQLEIILNEALDRLAVGQTQSTRGAGSVILIHKLVANDVRPNKPMLEKCLNQVLSLAERRKGDMAQALHLLGVLLKDSSMSQETARIIHKLAAACFNSLCHSSWAIRNTGLQLFGAIVPKLVGQRKQNEDDTTCSCYHLSYEELYYHTPELINLILVQLELGVNCSQKDAIAVHSKLVPLLTLLSNLSVGILTIIDRSIENIFNKLVRCFQALMSSSVFKVRQLAARSSAWFCSLSQLPSLVRTRVWKVVAYVNDRSLQNEIKTENGLHGFLLNTLYLYKRFQEEKNGVEALKRQSSTVDESIDELCSIRYSLNMSFVCKAVLEEIIGYDKVIPAREQLLNLCAAPLFSYKALGHPMWLSIVSKQIIEDCPLNELLPALNTALESNNFEVHIAVLQALNSRISKNEFESISSGTLNALLKFINQNPLDECLHVLLKILSKHKNIAVSLGIDAIIEFLCNQETDLSLAVASGLIILQRNLNINLLNLIVSRLIEMSKPSRNEISRILCSKSLNMLSPIMLRSVTQDISKARSEIWLSAVNLLQDESREVRIEASKFANNLVEGPVPEEIRNPYVSLTFLLNVENITGLFPPQYSINCLWSQLKCSTKEIDTLNKEVKDLLSPFNMRENNYQEHVKMAELIYDVLSSIMDKSQEAKNYFLKEEAIPYLRVLRSQAIQFLEFTEEHTHNKKIILNGFWYIIAKKLSLQFKLIDKLNSDNQDPNMFPFRLEGFIELMLTPPTPVHV